MILVVQTRCPWGFELTSKFGEKVSRFTKFSVEPQISALQPS